MHITDTGLTLFLTILIICVVVYGAFFGYTVDSGVATNLGDRSEDMFTGWTMLTQSLTFMFSLATFSIEDMPYIITIIFDVVCVLWVYLIIKIVRGVAS